MFAQGTLAARLAQVQSNTWWTDTHSGTLQAAFALVLVAVTIFYAYKTHRIASETARLAEETAKLSAATTELAADTGKIAIETARQAVQTERLASISVDQYQNATLPVIAFNLSRSIVPTVQRFVVTVMNAGAGPAVSLKIELGSSMNFRHIGWPIEPFTLAAADETLLTIELDNLAFLGTSDQTGWIFNPQATNLENQLKTRTINPEQFPNDPAPHYRKLLIETWNGYARPMNDWCNAQVDVGTLEASYTDVHGRRFISRIKLFFTAASQHLPDTWPDSIEETKEIDPAMQPETRLWRELTFGPLEFVRP